ncbi:MAG: hypothetical protein ACI378_08300 [Bacteroides sp.]
MDANAIAPIIGLSIYTNWLNHRQQYYVTRLAQTVDSENTLAANAFLQAKRIGYAEGKGSTEAEQFATTALKGRIAVQSTIVAMKDITGQTVIISLAAAHRGLSMYTPSVSCL